MTKRYTTSREFVKWKVYQMEEPNEFNPLFWYLALIATEIARANSKHPDRIKIKDRILNFVFKSGSKVPGGTVSSATNDADDMKDRISASKRAWLTMAGIFKIGKQRKK